MLARSSATAPVLAVIAIVLMPLASYVGGYFWLGRYAEFDWGALHNPPTGEVLAWRTFPRRWLMTLYLPAGRLESWVRGYDVDLSSDGPDTTPWVPLPRDVETMPEEAPEEEPRLDPSGVRIIINEATGQIVL